jgi:zinc protease
VFEANAQTKNESADEVVGLLMTQVQALGAAAPSPEELAARKATLIGEFARSADTGAGLAGLLTDDALYGIDPGEVTRYADAVEDVSPDAARAAAQKLAEPGQLDVVVVGDAKAFLPALKARFPNLRVIEADALDLDSPTLRKPGA